jgi:hypothetical protein
MLTWVKHESDGWQSSRVYRDAGGLFEPHPLTERTQDRFRCRGELLLFASRSGPGAPWVAMLCPREVARRRWLARRRWHAENTRAARGVQ